MIRMHGLKILCAFSIIVWRAYVTDTQAVHSSIVETFLCVVRGWCSRKRDGRWITYQIWSYMYIRNLWWWAESGCLPALLPNGALMPRGYQKMLDVHTPSCHFFTKIVCIRVIKMKLIFRTSASLGAYIASLCHLSWRHSWSWWMSTSWVENL